MDLNAALVQAKNYECISIGKRQNLFEMATGTGKTITAAGIIGKLYKVGLVRRVLFLVDRDSLAEQTVC
jgi:type I restriction enzyme R subunit